MNFSLNLNLSKEFRRNTCSFMLHSFQVFLDIECIFFNSILIMNWKVKFLLYFKGDEVTSIETSG